MGSQAIPEFSTPTALFQSPRTGPSPVLDQFDVTGDGQRFLFLMQRGQEAGVDPITVVVNWQQALLPD